MNDPWAESDAEQLARLRIERDDYALGCRGVLGDGYRGELFHEYLAALDRGIARAEAQAAAGKAA